MDQEAYNTPSLPDHLEIEPMGLISAIDGLAATAVCSSDAETDPSISSNQPTMRRKKKHSYRRAISAEKSPLPNQMQKGFDSQEIKVAIDWSESAKAGEHTWFDTQESGELCFFRECSASKHDTRKKCAGCKTLAHTKCIEQLPVKCKLSFREASPRSYRENMLLRHHWVHRVRQKGRCADCGKTFTQRFSFQSKEYVAICCVWCKVAFHAKSPCFAMNRITEECTLGLHAHLIIPPSWIIKLSQKGSFRQASIARNRHRSPSIRHRDSTVSSIKRRDTNLGLSSLNGDESFSATSSYPAFVIRPIPSSDACPLLVFINQRSGGNQGARIMHKLQWLLNPRQVFDLVQGGPRVGLQLYGRVPNLRILACGGDGTVGWILSSMDSLNISPFPPVAVLPLGTGNDLSRTLNWGGGYTDEPLSKILTDVKDGPVVLLDRWNLEVSKPVHVASADTGVDSSACAGVDRLPITVMNNYFSLGADAHVTLEFHESREANPEKFNSRFWNKMYYAGVGGKDILKRTWKDLCENITLQCDGNDLTAKIRELKFHCLLFLNIPKYAAGTTPWGSSDIFQPQRHDDGLLEVIGFTTATLAGLQIGAHGGVRLTQCRHACLTTLKTIPVQVDGEPCRLLPSTINITLRNQASMVQRQKDRSSAVANALETVGSRKLSSARLDIPVYCISIAGYESLHYDRRQLRTKSKLLGNISAESDSRLSHVRSLVELMKETAGRTSPEPPLQLSQNWAFIDTITAERFFRIDQGQESLYYVADIYSNELFIVDQEISAQSFGYDTKGSDHAVEGSESLAIEPRGSATSMPIIDPDEPVFSPDDTKPVVDIAHLAVGTNLIEQEVDNPAAHRSALDSSSGHQNLKRANATRHRSASSLCAGVGSAPIDLAREACNLGDLDKVMSIIANDPSLLEKTDQNGWTVLHFAVRYGHDNILSYVLQNVSATVLNAGDTRSGHTALHKAVVYNRKQAFKLLVEAGALPNAPDLQNNTAYQLAMMCGNQEMADHIQSVLSDQSTASMTKQQFLETEL